MSESLVRHVLAADPESLLALSLEDLGLLPGLAQPAAEAGLPLDGLEELPRASRRGPPTSRRSISVTEGAPQPCSPPASTPCARAALKGWPVTSLSS